MKTQAKKLLLIFLSLLILGCAPFGVFFGMTPKIAPRYTGTFLGGMHEKLERLRGASGQKIILVGGSSLPFGVRTPLIEGEIEDFSVVNFGLYADLGTKVMTDLSRDAINEGDIVILAPELNKQTYSLYFNANSTLMALERDFGARKKLPLGDRFKLFCASFEFNARRLAERNQPLPAAEPPYSADSLDEYGEISTARPQNIMPEGHVGNVTFEGLLDADFIDYVNKYAKFVTGRGATFYFSFSPTDADAVTASEAEIDGFFSALSERLDCEILGSPADFIYPSKYFYDTNFHLCDAGAVLHSVTLINLLKEKLGITSPTEIEIPEPGENFSGKEYEDGDDSFAECFEYERRRAFSVDGSEAYTYTIVGVKPEFAALESLIIPSTFESFPVTGIAKGALSSMSQLRELTVPKNCEFIEGGAFDGCSKLRRITILNPDAQALFVPYDGSLVRGCAQDLKIVVPSGRASLFKANYTWKAYAEFIVEK